jgi:integrase
MDQHGIKLAGDRNPLRRVERFKERAPEIRFLTMQQIEEQLNALRFNPRLQTIVAMYIYAGLRREEALWLTIDDVDLSRRGGGHGVIRVRAKTIGDQSWQPKTRINRAVPISAALRKYLDNYIPLKSAGGWYFSSPEAKRPRPKPACNGVASTSATRSAANWRRRMYRSTKSLH